MSPDRRMTSGWQLQATPAGLRVRRDLDGCLTVPLGIVRLGKHVALAPLMLSLDEADQLHAGLCFVLAPETPPVDAPECRKSVRYPGGRQQY
ncbi:hypothetical protein [Streptomyces cucumeris]|uniref:hypothetical protein n=1 Tax=Streptomyces cucumeris TaxID=2962890 RepID=UPI0020C894D7|nr:hypothetical protein [Streptomyces sp. NEAU-Y11]MCP9206075.1 hypothetical protein [Streptomyces sp. NEAU-Y11]